VVRWIVRVTGRAVALFLAVVLLYRFVNPPITPIMFYEAIAHRGLSRDYVDLDAISPALIRAVIASEDAGFFEHRGVDWAAVRRAREYNAKHGDEPRRGGSTITMQCARNVFLWRGKSYLRKGLEAVVAYVIELVWGKRRILDVYLNVIEWGPGVFGAEAAARTYFGVPAAALGPHQAALMAAVLPNPQRWSPALPTRFVLARAAAIERRAARVSLAPLHLADARRD
jgi:monofunctional biosynthetic peptidoglycan transglycosylase